MNEILEDHKTGKVGELLVQLKLLTFNIQAAPPIYDSGNDLIAVNGEVFKAIQVKTESYNAIEGWSVPKRSKNYHLLALVKLGQAPREVEDAKVYLFKREEIGEGYDTETQIPQRIRRMINESDSCLLSNRLDLFSQ